MKKALFALMLCLAGCGEVVSPRYRAESVPAPAPRTPGSIEHTLVSPHIILEHADELQLADAERGTILVVTDTTRTQLASLNTDLDRTTEALRVLLAATPIDEGAAMDAARAVSAVEDEIKFTHLRMLIRVQNTLTAEQRAQAQRYRTP
jgi:Spy/CpxP family protein refolding chaperone